MKLLAFLAFVATVSAGSILFSSYPQCELQAGESLTACGNQTVPHREPKIVAAIINLQVDEVAVLYSTPCGEPGKQIEVDKSKSCYLLPFEPLCVNIFSPSCLEVSCCHISVLLFVLTRLI